MELAENLVSLGCEIHVISRRVRKEDARVEKINGITVHRVYRWIVKPETRFSFTTSSEDIQQSRLISRLYYLYLLTIFRVYVSFICSRIISREKLNLIVERETSFGAGALASLFTGIPLILEIVGPRYSRLSAWRSTRIFYYTESMLRGWVDRGKCVSVPAGVNLTLFRKDEQLGKICRERLGMNSSVFVIGYVGTFQDWHGIQDLVTALVALKKIHSVKALLVGPGYERYEEISKSKGLENVCLFTGPVDYREVPGYINACDLMVALYNPNANALRKKYGIGSPIKVLEYMACGKPVISTRVKPIDQVVHENKDGILVEPGNPSEVEKCIRDLLSNPAKQLELGENGKQLVASKYSWNSVALAMLSYF